MPLIDMKRPVKKDEVATEAPTMAQEKYPWGLRITLEREELDKLGFNVKDFPIDRKCKIEGEADVVQISETERSKEKPDKSVSLQITHMAIPNKAGNPGKYHTYDKAQKAGPGEKA